MTGYPDPQWYPWTARLLFLAVLGSGATVSSLLGQDAANSPSAPFRAAARRVLPAVVSVRPQAMIVPRVLRPPIVVPGPEGSGVIVDAERGWVLTSDLALPPDPHVVVRLADGRELAPTDIRRDPRSGLALIVLPAERLAAAEWGDPEAVEPGDWVLWLGPPFAPTASVTAGVVAGTRRECPGCPYDDLIQTEAPALAGDLGGPVVDLQGRVIGIRTAFPNPAGPLGPAPFAVPAGRARHVAAELAEHGRVRRGSIGVRIEPLEPAEAGRLGVAGGLRIEAVALESPAAQAGLRLGDVILAVGNVEVRRAGQLQAAIETAPAGEPATLTILRDGERRAVEVRPTPSDGAAVQAIPPREPTPAPPVPAPADVVRNPTRFPALGLRLSEATPGIARQYGFEVVPEGLFVRGIEPGGPADQAGLEIGMVITDAGGRVVRSLADFRTALARRPADRDLILRILRGPKTEFRVILASSLPPPGGEDR
jgi:S1-C subfamily serine protease